MFKFTGPSAAGLHKLRRDIYQVTHKNHAQPQTNQFQPNVNNPQQTTLPVGTSGTPLVINNIYNNIPPMNQTVTNYAKKFSWLKAIFYALILTIIVSVLWYMITNGGIGHWLGQGIGQLHEFLTTIF